MEKIRERWQNATSIKLFVDGDIVNLKRVWFPLDTPILDDRFSELIEIELTEK